VLDSTSDSQVGNQVLRGRLPASLSQPLQRMQDSARLAAIIESSDDAIIAKTLDGIITDWNQGAERIFDYTAEEMVGQHISKLIPPEREAEEPTIQESLRRGVRVRHFETVRLARGGRMVHVSLTISPIRDESGEIVGASKIARDITDRKNAELARQEIEDRMRLAVDAAKLGLWDWDLQANVVKRSPMHAKLMGGTIEEQAPYDLSTANVHPDDLESTRLKLNEALITGNDYINEFRTVLEDGTIRWLEARGRAAFDDKRQPLRMSGIVIDITERKKSEEITRLRDAELAHLSRVSTMGNMAAGLAHELNQPLGAILNYAGVCQAMAKTTPLPVQTICDAIDEVMSETRRASSIISRLRAFVSKQAPQSALVDLHDLIRKSVALMDFEIRNQSVRFSLKLCDGSPKVQVDSIQIEQVLVNLMYNAMQAMEELPADRRSLTLQTCCTSTGLAEVSVIDSGPGVSPDILKRLFQPFFTTKAQGMGMGLNISRTIIENHAGRLSASINPGGGMQFRFTLPVE
jgi:two-component system sensor kinase FixL